MGPYEIRKVFHMTFDNFDRLILSVDVSGTIFKIPIKVLRQSPKLNSLIMDRLILSVDVSGTIFKIPIKVLRQSPKLNSLIMDDSFMRRHIKMSARGDRILKIYRSAKNFG